MLRATIYLDLDRDYVLSEISDRSERPFLVTQCEVIDGESIKFVIDAGDHCDGIEGRLRASEAVHAVERVGEKELLITKRSSGALPIIRKNHGMLQRMSKFEGTTRVFDVVVFRRADLKAIIADLRELGSVHLEKLKPFSTPSTPLSARQAEVLSLALEAGYYDWPRRTDAQTLAGRLGICHSTLLEHLRKAEKKLLSEALADASIAASPRSADRPPVEDAR
ncbi:helix-turn-helix domain-containing protein [Halegenticoccus tardaugens]|uniref:helix-turn-helix domain-containing protein n=1 Tax=Halegenticoccus tardaugens TaxID=2071624 RepID=UPI00100A7F64|nr:helix-turn-helix domain-containing protein [Halegenticoccus tardaugens]